MCIYVNAVIESQFSVFHSDWLGFGEGMLTLGLCKRSPQLISVGLHLAVNAS